MQLYVLTQNTEDGFNVIGVYSNYNRAFQDMTSQFESIRDNYYRGYSIDDFVRLGYPENDEEDMASAAVIVDESNYWEWLIQSSELI